MIVVGLVSCYKEGRLVVGAIKSLLDVGLDRLYVYEGPAGEPIEADVPDSELKSLSVLGITYNRLVEGRWRTDARKRQAMLEHVQRDYGTDSPVWGVIVDGDEILCNGAYVRDILQAALWRDERDPDGVPTSHWPLRLVEADGAVATIQGRLVRLDLLKRYVVSTSLVENRLGNPEGWGNIAQDSRFWVEYLEASLGMGRLVAWPPLPCEPHIFHRSFLRHPDRVSSRMHVQETEELARVKAADRERDKRKP